MEIVEQRYDGLGEPISTTLAVTGVTVGAAAAVKAIGKLFGDGNGDDDAILRAHLEAEARRVEATRRALLIGAGTIGFVLTTAVVIAIAKS